jgi:hypothetical protein
MTSKFEGGTCALGYPDVFNSVLWYACDHWAIHLYASSLGPELIDAVKTFGMKSLLCWIEALSLSHDSTKALQFVRGVNQLLIAKVNSPLLKNTPRINTIM